MRKLSWEAENEVMPPAKSRSGPVRANVVSAACEVRWAARVAYTGSFTKLTGDLRTQKKRREELWSVRDFLPFASRAGGAWQSAASRAARE